MPLPYEEGDPDISSPDDVESYQHVNRVLGKHDDAVDLIDEQHNFDTDNAERDLHDIGRMPQGWIGMLYVRPPLDRDEKDAHTILVQKGEVGETHWHATQNKAQAATEHWFEILHPKGRGAAVTTPFLAADVHSEIGGALAGEDLKLIRPAIDVDPTRIRIYFGRGDARFLQGFLVLIHGRRTGA